MLAEGYRAGIVVPLVVGSSVAGRVCLAWQEPQAFDDATRGILQDLAGSIALALRQARLRESSELRAAALATVHEVALGLRSSTSLRDLARAAVEALERLVGHRYGAILLVDEASGRLTPFALSNQGHADDPAFIERDVAAIEAHDLRVGVGVTGWVAEHGESVRLGDVLTDPRYVAVRDGLRSELAVPIRLGQRILGVVNVESPEPDAYTADDQLVLETIAAQFAVAFENARILDELEQRVAQRTVALTDANLELDAFSASVSHDMRAPLRAMHGFATALLEDEGERLSPDGLGYTRRIAEAADRMEEIIRDLLEYGRLARDELRPSSVDLDEIVAAAVAQHDSEISASGAVVRVEAGLGHAHGHRATLVQVVSNLIGNALKYVASGTHPAVHVHAERRRDRVRIWFEDNGIGIAVEERERIFQPFERLHGIEAYPGTGIGLALVRRGAERMGGTCGVEERAEGGSRFWLELPAGGSS